MTKLKNFIKQATEEYGWGASFLNHEKLEELIRADEREACAKVCELGLPIATNLNALDDMEMWGEKFAKAIRARGDA